MIKGFLEEVLQVYEFPEDKKARLINFFSKKIEEEFIDDQARIYEYVTTKLDEWSVPYQERHAKRLYASISNRKGDKSVVLDLLGVEDNELETSMADSGQGIKLSQAVEILKDKLDDLDYKILKELSKKSTHDLSLKLDEVGLMASANRLISNLHHIAELFYNNGLVTPNRRIHIVSHNPLVLKIGRLDEETIKAIYKIPETGIPWSRAARQLGVSISTIKYHLNKAGYENSPFSRGYDDLIKNWVKKELEGGQTLAAVALKFGIAESTISLWRRKLEIKQPERKEDDDRKVASIEHGSQEEKQSEISDKPTTKAQRYIVLYDPLEQISENSNQEKPNSNENSVPVGLYDRTEFQEQTIKIPESEKTEIEVSEMLWQYLHKQKKLRSRSGIIYGDDSCMIIESKESQEFILAEIYKNDSDIFVVPTNSYAKNAVNEWLALYKHGSTAGNSKNSENAENEKRIMVKV